MSKITEYQNLLEKIFDISSNWNWMRSVCVYLVEDGVLEFRLDAPNDELVALTVKFIEDPIFMQCTHMWTAKDTDLRKHGMSHRFFRITGKTEEEIKAKLMYMKMVL